MKSLNKYVNESKVTVVSAADILAQLFLDKECDWYYFTELDGAVDMNEMFLDYFGPSEDDENLSSIEFNPEDFEELGTFNLFIIRQRPLECDLKPYAEAIDTNESGSFNRNKIYMYIVK